MGLLLSQGYRKRGPVLNIIDEHTYVDKGFLFEEDGYMWFRRNSQRSHRSSLMPFSPDAPRELMIRHLEMIIHHWKPGQ